MNNPVQSGSKRVMEALGRWAMVALVAVALSAAAADAPAATGVAAPAVAAGPAGEAPKGTVLATPGGGKVVINAKSVLYDFAKRVAQFETQVSVTDSQVVLTADRMDVYLTADNAVQRVEALGNVVIRELGTAKKATAGKAVYDVTEDTVVLTEQPYLEERDQGFSTRGAERIVYLRAKQQFKAEGENVQIQFDVKSDGAHAPADLFRPKEDGKAAGGGAGQAAPGKQETPAP